MNNKRFRRFVNGHRAAAPLLPGVHITNVTKFGKMLQTNRIDTKKCKFYKRQLSYFFYGKPVYKLARDPDIATKILGDAAVCVVLNLAALPVTKRIFAFDTGASFGHRYDKYMPDGISIDDFEIDADIRSPGRIVSSFFGNNRNYYEGNLKRSLRIDPLDRASEVYSNIVNSSLSEQFDERACSCELQFGKGIDLNERTVLSLVMPRVLAGSPEVRNILKKRWKVRPILYTFKRAKVGERTEVIYEKLSEFYAGRKFI